MPLGIVLGENHFKAFNRKPFSGVFLRIVWLIGGMLLVMTYQGNLKVVIKLLAEHLAYHRCSALNQCFLTLS